MEGGRNGGGRSSYPSDPNLGLTYKKVPFMPQNNNIDFCNLKFEKKNITLFLNLN